MKSILSLTAFLFLAIFSSHPSFAQQGRMDGTLYFSKNESLLLPEGRALLDSLAAWLATAPDCVVNLMGHTDDDGDPAYNQALSERRVAAVRQYLIGKGVPGPAIVQKAFGEQRPAASNDDEAGKQRNRRVGFEAVAAMREVPPPMVVQTHAAETRPADLFARLQPEPLLFCFNPKRDTLLRCPGGTVFHLKANSFEVPPGTACLTLKVLEAYRKSEMVRLRLTTTSEGNLLETQGMFWVSVEDGEGRPVPMLRSNALAAFVPVDHFREDIRIFEGIRHEEGGPINWVEDRASLTNLRAADFENCMSLSGGEERCPFFFCRIGKFFGKRPAKKPVQANGQDRAALNCPELEQLMKKYGVGNIAQLANALGVQYDAGNGVLFGGFSVLRAAKKKDIQEGRSDVQDLNCYVFRVTSYGWRNCDVYSQLPKELLVSMPVLAVPSPSLSLSLVFKDTRALVPALPYGGEYRFTKIPKNENAWLVALKYEEGKTFLAIKPVVTGTDAIQFDFKETTLEELENALDFLDI